MKPQPIDSVSFGIYLKTRKTSYGQCDYGIFRNKNIEIYTAKENGKLIHKLFMFPMPFVISSNQS